MTDLEKVAIKKFAKDLVDEHIPQIISAEIEKVPEAYKGVVKAIWDGMWPMAKAALDAKIDAI